jgi:O-antigen ligase
LEKGFLEARVGALWKGLRQQPLFFWLLCVYVGVEYLRPQTVYPALNVFPFGEVSIGACLIAWTLGGGRLRRLEAMDFLILAFFGWVAVTSFTAFRPSESWGSWTAPGSWVALYFLVTHILTTRHRIFLFWVAFFFVNLKMSQHGARAWAGRGFSFAGWGVTGSPGWFQNSGEFAMQMAGFLGFSWCFLYALKPFVAKWKWWILVAVFPVTAIMSILASSSRGGQLAGACVVLALLLIHKMKFRTVLLSGLVLVLGWQFVPPEQKARFETIGDDETSQARLRYWADSWEITKQYPLVGIGYENWIPYIEAKQNEIVKENHNTILEGSVEMGFPGAGLFLAMVALSFVVNRQTRRRTRILGPWGRVYWGMAIGLDVLMIGLFVAAQFMSVLFYPIFWMSFALTTALSITSRRDRDSIRAIVQPRPYRMSQQLGAVAFSPAYQARNS